MSPVTEQQGRGRGPEGVDPMSQWEAALGRRQGDFDSGLKGHLFPSFGRFLMLLVERGLVSWADRVA